MALVFGIDTGAWRVRAAAKEGSFGRFSLRDVQEMVRVAGWEQEVAAFRTNEPGWDAAERVVAWPLDAGVVRLVKLPFGDKAAIARALPAEVEASAPYDLDDMQLVSRTLDSKDKESRTLAFVAPRDELVARIEALTTAGSEPKHVVFDAEALASWSDRGVQVVVDVGHRRTILALCQNGQLIGARAVNGGGAEFSEAVAAAAGCSLSDGEALKHTLSVPEPTTVEWEDRTDGKIGQEPTSALADAVDAWSIDVRAELLAMEDESGLGIDEVLLVGGSARLSGLARRLSARLGVTARTLTLPGGYGPECALVLGLAKIAAGEWKGTDLRTGALSFHGHADTLWSFMMASTLGTGVALVAGVVLFVLRYTDGQGRLAELEARGAEVVTTAFPDVPATSLSSPSVTLAIMQEKVAATTERVEALGATVGGTPPTLDMLKVLSESVPAPGAARIDVKELNIAEAAVTLKAETDSYESAAAIEAALQGSERFKQAEKSDEKKVGEALTFSITIPLGEAETEAEGSEG